MTVILEALEQIAEEYPLIGNLRALKSELINHALLNAIRGFEDFDEQVYYVLEEVVTAVADIIWFEIYEENYLGIEDKRDDETEEHFALQALVRIEMEIEERK